MEQVVEPPRTPKALLAAVIGMGVLIVFGTITLVAIIIHRMNSHPATAALPVHVPLQDAALPAPALPPGTKILSMARVQDNLLALHILENGMTEKVLLWDVNAHTLTQGLLLPPAAPQP